jgi:hypothetical protein
MRHGVQPSGVAPDVTGLNSTSKRILRQPNSQKEKGLNAAFKRSQIHQQKELGYEQHK